MKKQMMIVVGIMALSSSAFAQTYSCDILKDSKGNAILGGPSYAIVVEGQNVDLQVTTGADEGGELKTEEFKMEKTAQEVEGATYEAQGVNASLFVAPGTGHELVSISKKVGSQEVSASCSVIDVTSLAVPLTSSDILSVRQWVDGTTGLAITGESATIQFPCGSISIAKGWNTVGRPMDGLNHMGPVEMGPGTPVTVTANLLDGKIYLKTSGDDAATYTFTPGTRPMGPICL